VRCMPKHSESWAPGFMPSLRLVIAGEQITGMTELLQLIAELETFARGMHSKAEFIRTPPLTCEEIDLIASFRKWRDDDGRHNLDTDGRLE